MTSIPRVTGRESFAAVSGVSRETLVRIDCILETLDAWRSRLNLMGPRDWDHVWRRHVWDSAQILDRLNVDDHIVDLGSGAGFPGLIVAAARADLGGAARVSLIEKSPRKAAFLRAAAAGASLNIDVYNDEIANVPGVQADSVVSRALAPMPRLLDLAAPWLENGAKGVFHKGSEWGKELTAARENWTFTHEAIPSRSDASGVILIISEVRRVG